MPDKRVVIIGGGIGGLAASILLAKQGYKVEIYEKLDSLGGRARQFSIKGFTFDMGPSWFLMPRVYKHFFELAGEDINKHLAVMRLKPAYKVIYEKYKPIDIIGDLVYDMQTFERIEAGSGEALKQYVERARMTYQVALESFLYTNYDGVGSFLQTGVFKRSPKLASTLITSLDNYVSKYFKDPRLKQILEYHSVFLGTSPYSAPAMYHLMSALDFDEGIYYPEGGMYAVIEALIRIARSNGVKLHANTPVRRIHVEDNKAKGVVLENGKTIEADLVISNADLHFTETMLLEKEHQTYPASYWWKRSPGPSALMFYLGIKGSLPRLFHHNLFFADDWKGNFDSIYEKKVWPETASMYICKPTEMDKSLAPAGHENLVVLVPLPAKPFGKQDENELIERYFNQFKQVIKEPDIEKRIVYKQVYTPNDFARDYNAWEYSALGLSHTLRQSANFRPGNQSKKVSNLYYVGANTMPGIGLPMCLISAELLIKRINGIKSASPLEKLP